MALAGHKRNSYRKPTGIKARGGNHGEGCL